ncbi:hypothetical protein [Singulisphaera sp. PoT]|uniref:hypothetical protein n=1 Tax=Singulisphaera sp. PoT TaxID=3411797 RepID=UPI003BF5E61D
MVAATNNGTNKTAFVVDVLQKNPKANPVFVNQAWKDAGHEGSISGTLVHKIRAELGLAGNLRSRTKGTSGEKKSKSTRSSASATKEASTAAPAASKSLASSNGVHTNHSKVKPSRTSERDRILMKAEGEIDRIIFSLIQVGGLVEIEDALRRVRRMIGRTLEV